MAHYAQLNSENVVVSVFVGRDENDLPEGVTDWEIYYAPEGYTVKRTSYNTLGGVHSQGGEPFRYNYAGIGYTFDPNRGTDGAFIAPKPFDSWLLNDDTCLWEAPIPLPDDADTVPYVWDEATTSWVADSQE